MPMEEETMGGAGAQQWRSVGAKVNTLERLLEQRVRPGEGRRE